MAYRLKAKETIPEGVQRVVLEEITGAIEVLGKSGTAQRDESVHEARKSIKKIRGVLRLARPELRASYRDENSRFREIGHLLSELRDTAALLEVFDQLIGKFSGTLDPKSAADIRRGLEREKNEVEQQLDLPKVVARAAGTLRSAQARVKRWPLRKDGFSAIAPGIKLTYRSGRKALKAARKNYDPVSFHTLRKRVKDHWYHVRLLESVWTEVMEAHEKSLKELETWLGDNHNLAVLREKLEGQPDRFGGSENVQVFLLLVSKYQEELRQNSLSLGARIYGVKPRAFVRSLGTLWDTWKQLPDTTNEVDQPQRENLKKQPPKTAARKSKRTAA